MLQQNRIKLYFKSFLVISITFLGFFCFAQNSKAVIIFQENYDGITSNKNASGSFFPYNPPTTTQGAQMDWSHWSASPSDYQTLNEVSHYSGDISAPGRGETGQALKQWRRNGPYFMDYTGYLNPQKFNWNTQKYRDLYFRYYFKWPHNLTVPTGVGTKFNRAYAGSSEGSSDGELYLGAEGALGDSGHFYIYLAGMGTGERTFRSESFLALGVNDGDWHCLEFHVKFNTPDQGDGIVGLFIDGNALNLSYYPHQTDPEVWSDGEFTSWSGVPSDYYFTRAFVPGIGNTGNSVAPYVISPDEWTAMEFDDYIVSTTYIGPESVSGDTTPPASPSGLIVS